MPAFSREQRRRYNQEVHRQAGKMRERAASDSIFELSSTSGMGEEEFRRQISLPRDRISAYLGFYRDYGGDLAVTADKNIWATESPSIDNEARIQAYFDKESALSPEALREVILSPVYLFDTSVECAVHDIKSEPGDDNIPTLTGALLSAELQYALDGEEYTAEDRERLRIRAFTVLSYTNSYKTLLIAQPATHSMDDQAWTDGTVRRIFYGSQSRRENENLKIWDVRHAGVVGVAKKSCVNVDESRIDELHQMVADLREWHDKYDDKPENVPDQKMVWINGAQAENQEAFDHNLHIGRLLLTYGFLIDKRTRQWKASLPEVEGLVEALEFIHTAAQPEMQKNIAAAEKMYGERITKIENDAEAAHQARMEIAEKARLEKLEWQELLRQEAEEERQRAIQEQEEEARRIAQEAEEDAELARLIAEDETSAAAIVRKSEVERSRTARRLQRIEDVRQGALRRDQKKQETEARRLAEQERERREAAEAEAARKRRQAYEDEMANIGKDWQKELDFADLHEMEQMLASVSMPWLNKKDDEKQD
ncbi:hypothetical protein FWF64_01750 [Candidatus Saccharibacteria bacterium]|nr:hypothetical protein [Candidatus Saccharibacteria bacterium]